MLKVKKTSALVTASLLAALALAPGASAATPTTLTTTQKAQLKYLIEEEKLARDVYTYLATNVTSQKFSNILKSEQTHMDAVAAILKTYKLANPTTSRKPGVFKNDELQKLYKDLIAQGKASPAAAIEVGVSIEELDISDLEKMLEKKWPADVKLMLENLLKASYNHLAAFQR
jgi:hypothetical protein